MQTRNETPYKQPDTCVCLAVAAIIVGVTYIGLLLAGIK